MDSRDEKLKQGFWFEAERGSHAKDQGHSLETENIPQLTTSKAVGTLGQIVTYSLILPTK